MLLGVAIATLSVLGASGGYMLGMMGYGWRFAVPIAIIFLVLIAWGVYYFITGSVKTSRAISNRHGKALEILKERYATGEIKREQFLQMKRELES